MILRCPLASFRNAGPRKSGRSGDVAFALLYEVDARDVVVRLKTVPACDAGAPMPALPATEQQLDVAYIARAETTARETIVVATFDRPYSHMFGPPNEGHPLAGRGLEPYGAFRVDDSSWMRRLEGMNGVHEFHRPEACAERTHFILSFHDSTFECVAASVRFAVHAADEPLTLSVSVIP
jgi:hypothetical protein